MLFARLCLMSCFLNLSDFQKLTSGNLSMCDIVASLRLINENINYLNDFPDDKISVDMKMHLIEDREYILKQAQHNINIRLEKKELKNNDNDDI